MITNDKRTLCARCYRDYVSAGYTIRRDYNVTAKDDCDICGRPGWEYWVIKGEHHAR